MNETLRRKLRRITPEDTAAVPGGEDHAWRLALARATREGAGLASEITSLASSRRDLAELPELLPDRALIALLDGPAGAMGMIALSPGVMSALIEMQTIGRVGAAAPAARRPTRTDAAMVSVVIDRALGHFDLLLRGRDETAPVAGFRYASFLEDARSLGLLLEDQPWRVSLAQLSLADGARSGEVVLALPESTFTRRADSLKAQEPAGEGQNPSLAPVVGPAQCVLRAVLAQHRLSLHEVLDLAEGQVLTLAGAALDRITLEGVDGLPLALARLGQQRGYRALRLTELPPGDAAATPTPVTKFASHAVVSSPPAPGLEEGGGLEQPLLGATG
ncbi:FliM/FliN family flagellar motor C-terminal domain-containing protein [Pseudogemmobacter humi]|uniref:Surface presentation of antigens (SPOA) n=1 Tax=Pseudogemmobacter humi TaxID=2483812 RepID=A0A3P5XMI3_9RHOB|nr:FliM/FliN family flagellar motor C-terminal domain-containing protein [Pseudogemmobacter humi]VDC32001.1 Surface presentation of antigens (SPOA) [Pseudogemmobacter humi]